MAYAAVVLVAAPSADEMIPDLTYCQTANAGLTYTVRKVARDAGFVLRPCPGLQKDPPADVPNNTHISREIMNVEQKTRQVFVRS